MCVTGLAKATYGVGKLCALNSAIDKDMAAATMDTMANKSEKAFRDLTENTPGFIDYFYECTVCEEIALMNIGSRPARRKQADRYGRETKRKPTSVVYLHVYHTVNHISNPPLVLHQVQEVTARNSMGVWLVSV